MDTEELQEQTDTIQHELELTRARLAHIFKDEALSYVNGCIGIALEKVTELKQSLNLSEEIVTEFEDEGD